MNKALLVVMLLILQYYGFGQAFNTGFTAAFNSRKNAVTIKWQNGAADIKSYAIQRSPDNKSWADIALQARDTNTDFASFYFEDKQPSTGENYYRLKSISIGGKIAYSPAVMVIMASPVNNWVMYPVPVQTVLTLEYRGNEKIKSVINVMIQQSSGRILSRLRYSSLSKVITIPVDNLGKGIYDVRIIIDGDIVWNQRFVK